MSKTCIGYPKLPGGCPAALAYIYPNYATAGRERHRYFCEEHGRQFQLDHPLNPLRRWKDDKAMKNRLKNREKELNEEIAAMEKTERIPVGSTTRNAAKRLRLLVEEMFIALPDARRGRYLGHLNEILCYITAADRAINPPIGEKKE